MAPSTEKADVEPVLRAHGLLEPQPIAPAVKAEVIQAGAPLWYIGSFAPRLHEKVAKGLAEVGWLSYCPMATEWQDVKRPKPKEPRRIAVKRPLFGTYLLLHPAEGAIVDFQSLERIDGFGGLVKKPATHIAVRCRHNDEDLERLRGLEEIGFFDNTRDRPPKVKHLDRILITEGPFKGLQGIVDKPMGERVKVLMEMFGVVDMPMDSVEVYV